MDSRPPCLLRLLLTSLLHFWQCAGSQSSYTINTVGLRILPNKTVESGTLVGLSCEVSVSHDPSLQLTHIFQFLRYDVPVHSVNTTDTKALYKLSPARAADSGTYECKVTVMEKSRTSDQQKLTVTGLQTPVLQLSKTVLYEREELIGTCSAPEEKGALTFYFYEEAQCWGASKIKQVGPSGNSSETRLDLRLPGDRLLYCNYEIPTLSEAGRSMDSSKIQVIVKALHISPIMNVLPSTTVYEGDIIEVVCKVVSPPASVEVYLTKDNTILQKANIGLSHRYTAKAGDSGELVCKAELGSMQKETYKTVTIKDLFSKPLLTVEPRDIFEGERFKLTCSVSSYAAQRIDRETIQFSIYRDDILLSKSHTYSAVAHSSQNGNYTCKASVTTQNNDFVKKIATLVVKTKVPVSQPTLSVVGGTVVLGKPFLLKCHSENGSLPITYSLYASKQKQHLQLDVKEVRKPGDQAVFNISGIQSRLDISKFFCKANNNQFKPEMRSSEDQLQHTAKIIEPVLKPMLTTHPTGDVSEGNRLTLVCLVKGGSPPINFTWYHSKREGALDSQTSPNDRASYTIPDVTGEHGGEYYCMSNNQANEIKRSNTVTVGVKLAGWKQGLIALFCILLIGALVLVFVIKKGLLPFKRNKTSELSVKSASTKVERLSLTQAEVNEAANVTPGVMGRSVWSEHVSGSESDDQNSVASPEGPETQYTEVQTKQVDPSRVPLMKGTDTVYSEVRNSKQDVPEQVDGGSVEYAQLNHDVAQHSAHAPQADHAGCGIQDDLIDDLDDIDPADIGECNSNSAPNC
ncbi:LOW QUALITY PROTEIN: platelet endothelial cell adhesion molecule [Myripristis murdjan]|uniref:LOW QUALITY PROTEIN: platelet endothelial cell adhesion molecule n=1 Tax=Myripristis murdjan TaxID=586833 RepID=UPI003F498772